MANKNDELQQSWFVKIKKCVTVEPILLAIGIPFYLQRISLQNFALEKACRVNLQFSEIVCDNMIDKAMNGINCGKISLAVEQLIETAHRLNATFYNLTSPDAHLPLSLEQDVCLAEIESQKFISTISGYMAPFESILGVIAILIGGYWSDVSGRRKPLILYSIVGDFLAQVVFLIGAIFMNELPVEFVSILGALIGAMSGGISLLFMAIFCFMTEITKEKDRVFRFGLLYQLYPFMAICVLPFSGILHKILGYIKIFFVSLLLQIIGIFYTLFILKESPAVIENSQQISQKTAVDQLDPTFEINELKTNEEHISATSEQKNQHRTNFNIFNAIRDVIFVLMRKRSGKGRLIIWLLILCNFVYVGCEYEYVNEYFFVRTKLNWEGSEESRFAAYGSGTAFFGNILMTSVLSKYLKIPDTIIGLISSLFSTIAKLIFITVSTTFMLYVARSFDMFTGVNDVAMHSILSVVVNKNEIGRIFSLMGLLENLGKLIFLPIYANVYKRTVATFPNAYFIVSFGGTAIITFIFGIIAFALHTFFTAGWTAAKCVGTAMLEERSELILLAPTSLYASMSTIRIYIVMFNFNKIKQIFDEITEFELETDEEFEYISEKIKRFSKSSVAYVLFMFSALGSALVAPIFEKERVLPVPIWLPLDWENNLLNYWMAYIFSTLGQLSLVVLNSFLAIFIWFLMYANALKLRLLGRRLSKLGYLTIEEKQNRRLMVEYQNESVRSLLHFIKVHKEISNNINGIQDMFSQIFFIQIVSSALCICSVTYLMASENLTNNYNNFVMYVSLFCIYNYEISQLMFYGNEITLASEELMSYVYHSNWPDLSIKYRKIALIFMERLKKPQEMLIGKVFPLNLKSLTSILRVAYSCFNVLRSNEQGKSPY